MNMRPSRKKPSRIKKASTGLPTMQTRSQTRSREQSDEPATKRVKLEKWSRTKDKSETETWSNRDCGHVLGIIGQDEECADKDLDEFLTAHPRLRRISGGYNGRDHFSRLSLEILCQIMSYLPLVDTMKMESLCHKLHEAVSMHLRLTTKIDFTESHIYGWMPSKFTDDSFMKFLMRCPLVTHIYGLNPRFISKRRQRGKDILSIPGLIAALSISPSLTGIETCDIFVLEAILMYLPKKDILRTFQNRNGRFPIPMTNKFELTRNPRITSLNLTGVVIPELPRMDHIKHLHLKWTKLTDPNPFEDFGVPLLRTFVMSNCDGPTSALKYVPLITGLAAARSLVRLELVRVPFLVGLIQHVVEDSWRMHGFRQLQKIIVGACKHALEVDVGYLAITCAHRLTELAIQPSLTKDSFFSSLTMADVDFPLFETLHLGHVDCFPESGKWSSEELVAHGLAEVTESPSMITDLGMRSSGRAFPNVKYLNLYNCPHLHSPTTWFTQGIGTWSRLKELHLRRCHAIRLADFRRLIPMLVSLESLILEQMFREPPKGCSRVGLSAGTGLGVSSALVQNTNNEVSNQDLVNNNPPAQVNPPGPNNAMPAAGFEPMVDLSDNEDDNIEMEEIEEEMFVVREDEEEYELPIQDEEEDAESVNEEDEERNEHMSNLVRCEGCRASRKCPADESTDSEEEAGPSGCSQSKAKWCSRCSCRHTQKTKCNCKKPCPGYVAEGDRCEKAHAPVRRSRRLRSGEADRVDYVGKGKSLRGNKKGIIKKSGSKVNQSCQATSEEIREMTKKAKENDGMKSPTRAVTTRSQAAEGKAEAGPSCSGYRSAKHPSRKSATDAGSSKGPAKRKYNMVDRMTSTSDPVVDEDVVQILTIHSSSLVNVSLRNVGITDLVFHDCPKLQMVSGSACRVLRDVLIKSAPRLSRLSFAQCRKLRNEDLVDEVCMQAGEKNRLIFLTPLGKYNRLSLEKELFRSPLCDYHLCLLHDYSPNPEETLYNRLRVQSWLEIMANINFELLKNMSFPEASSQTCEQDGKRSSKYPWGRNIYRMQGSGIGGHPWDMVTDLPWLRTLAGSAPLGSQMGNLSDDDMKPGVYCPRARGHNCTEMCMDAIQEDIAEAKQTGLQLHCYSVIVHVNMCDATGVPAPDRYV